jgi:hypothetical protein
VQHGSLDMGHVVRIHSSKLVTCMLDTRRSATFSRDVSARRVSSAIGKERGYMLRVTRFASLGFSFANFAVHVHDLPDGIGIDGLLGLSFLRHFNYEVRSQEGRIHIHRTTG